MKRRKDNKGRVLNEGESQRTDGRYIYQYKDNLGDRKAVYSWRLLPSDKTPKGKRKGLSLREKEKQILADLNNGIIPCGGNMTVLDLVQKHVSQKKGVRYNTETKYQFVINLIKKEEFSAVRIDNVKLSDAKAWIIKLQEDGRSYGTIQVVRSVVKPAFQMAVDDDLLVKNPFTFQLRSVIANDTETKEALTQEQEMQYLDFIKDDKCFSKHYDGIYILFKTGLRISEFCGLIKEDIDFKNGRIRVERQLQRKRNMQYFIGDTKTPDGVRYIPMTNEVKDCFKHILENRKKPKIEPVIRDIKGNLYHGFLFLDKDEKPMVARHWESYMQRIRAKYNKIHNGQMPIVTPHVCRHTFCSIMAKNGMNPKVLQYIMGHSDISITLNVYAHTDFENAMNEMKRIDKEKTSNTKVFNKRSAV